MGRNWEGIGEVSRGEKNLRRQGVTDSNYMISIIMPTYNSEHTIEYSLRSIRRQSIKQTQVEILLVDGGSSDKTLEIAKKYNVKVLYNKQKLPEFAKQQGMLAATGRYGIFIDSDESFINMESLRKRIDIFQKYHNVCNIVSTGQTYQKNEIGVVRYANFIGDPFSNFVYRYNGYNRIEDLSRQYPHKDIGEGLLLDFRDSRFYPLFDALGNMFDLDVAKSMYAQSGNDRSFAANIFSNMVRKTKCAIVMKDDFICHRAGMTGKTYLDKLKWRVKNNLFQTEGVGFAQRSRNESGLQRRKILYIPYCMLIFPAVADAVRFSVKNKDFYFLTHFFYAEYTFIMILWYSFLKLIHYPVKMEKTYGKDINQK